jgi:hypothetical protein
VPSAEKVEAHIAAKTGGARHNKRHFEESSNEAIWVASARRLGIASLR